MIRILIVDDEKEIGTFLSHLFMSKGYRVTVVNSGKDFYYLDLKKQRFHIALLDLKLPDANGLSLLEYLKQQQPACKAVIMTGYSTIQTAVDAMKLGASNYLEKPFDDIDILEQQIDELLAGGDESVNQYLQEAAVRSGLVIGKSEKMKQLLQTVYKVAQKPVNILIEGETGTGKEVLAHFIHEASPRSKEAFIGVNCGAISESLLESELFGHEKGAFTGAAQQRKGLFELTSKGTLFLDEVAEASHLIQVKLLRVLETREFMRVGGTAVLRTNARVIAASNENLQEAVRKKTFREDLFYRLNVVHVKIPPLRERQEDIPLLIQHMLERYGSGNISFSKGAIRHLQEYHWPGNIRELANFVARTIALLDSDQTVITEADLPLWDTEGASIRMPSALESDDTGKQNHELEEYLRTWSQSVLTTFEKKDDVHLEDVLAQVKQLESQIGKAFILKALQNTLGNRSEAAKRLQITMRKLRYLLNEKKGDTGT
ncbi:sigma-54-dependent transcriptional regulator [Ectobacillus funiculus]|uniref:sigma-54-dependent transcriptional regulator n=1 Tax=Ectobacillus funiculus TaxID=137993 RepID=UPI00101CF9F0|nr:sigma-54 dependent transcriptional regulator [Ectobacillus funiculus]